MTYEQYKHRLFDFIFDCNEDSNKMEINQFHISRQEIEVEYAEHFKKCYSFNVSPQYALSTMYELRTGKKIDYNRIPTNDNHGFKKLDEVERINELRRKQCLRQYFQ